MHQSAFSASELQEREYCAQYRGADGIIDSWMEDCPADPGTRGALLDILDATRALGVLIPLQLAEWCAALDGGSNFEEWCEEQESNDV